MRIYVPSSRRIEFRQQEGQRKLQAVVDAWPQLSWWDKTRILFAVWWWWTTWPPLKERLKI